MRERCWSNVGREIDSFELDIQHAGCRIPRERQIKMVDFQLPVVQESGGETCKIFDPDLEDRTGSQIPDAGWRLRCESKAPTRQQHAQPGIDPFLELSSAQRLTR